MRSMFIFIYSKFNYYLTYKPCGSKDKDIPTLNALCEHVWTAL